MASGLKQLTHGSRTKTITGQNIFTLVRQLGCDPGMATHRSVSLASSGLKARANYEKVRAHNQKERAGRDESDAAEERRQHDEALQGSPDAPKEGGKAAMRPWGTTQTVPIPTQRLHGNHNRKRKGRSMRPNKELKSARRPVRWRRDTGQMTKKKVTSMLTSSGRRDKVRPCRVYYSCSSRFRQNGPQKNTSDFKHSKSAMSCLYPFDSKSAHVFVCDLVSRYSPGAGRQKTTAGAGQVGATLQKRGAPLCPCCLM